MEKYLGFFFVILNSKIIQMRKLFSITGFLIFYAQGQRVRAQASLKMRMSQRRKKKLDMLMTERMTIWMMNLS